MSIAKPVPETASVTLPTRFSPVSVNVSDTGVPTTVFMLKVAGLILIVGVVVAVPLSETVLVAAPGLVNVTVPV